MGPSALLRKMTPESVLKPLNYLTIIWATILDYVFYDDLPDPPTVMGALIIAGSGLCTFHRERVRTGRKEASTP